MTSFIDPFSEEVWRNTYKHHTDISVDDTLFRTAKYMASAEKSDKLKEIWLDKFEDILKDFKFTTGGRIYSNAGTGWNGTTLINCYVGGNSTKYPHDSLLGILDVLENQSLTLKSEGGWGHNFSHIRPRGSFIHGIGVETPGAIKYMELFDKASDIITSGSGLENKNKKAKGKIRKGAMMGVLDIWHPDIIEFISAKQTPGRLTKFNISVNCTKPFMNKVEKLYNLKFSQSLCSDPYDIDNIQEEIDNLTWDLVYPDTQYKNYNEEWDGNLNLWLEKGYPIKIINTVKVEYLWNFIMESTYKRNEPGILFLDRGNELSPCNYMETIRASNPCITGDTTILTDKGYKRIDKCIGKKINIWNGYEWSIVIPKITGYNQKIMKIIFSDGSELKCTPYHKFILADGSRIEAKNLVLNDPLIKHDFPIIEGNKKLRVDAYTQGFFSGDGYNHKLENNNYKNEIWIYAEKHKLIEKLNYETSNVYSSDDEYGQRTHLILSKKMYDKTFVPEVKYSIRTRLKWLAGLIDSDGSKNDIGGSIAISSTNKDFLLNVKYMMNTLGINSVVIKENDIRISTIRGKSFIGNPTYRIVISASNVQKLRILGLKTYRVDSTIANPSRTATRYIRIKNIEYLKKKAKVVYCFNEKKNHSGIFNGVLTAQCAEQLLSDWNICDLGSINLTQFTIWNEKERKYDFDLINFRKVIPIAIRFLDNVLDKTTNPLKEYDNSCKLKRRIGLGILGWGSLLYMMKIRFGSDESRRLIDKIMHYLTYDGINASIDLAIEKGPFPLCDPKKHAKSKYYENINLDSDTIKRIETYGIRNSSLFSIQPTGNTSVFANIVSGGLEPVFLPEYIRTVIVNHVPEHIKDVTPKWYEGIFEETEMFKWAKEGDETILRGVDNNGIVYKIDSNRGLTKEVLCMDYGVRMLKEKGEWDSNANWAVTALSISVEDHAKDLIAFSRWLDSSASKTINCPTDYSFDDFKDIYYKCYKSGYIKGVTTYRNGTMSSVLAKKETQNEEIIIEDVKIPSRAPAEMVVFKAEKIKWYVTVLLDEKTKSKPFALFAHTNIKERNILTHDVMDRMFKLALSKGIPQKYLTQLINKMIDDDNLSKMCRSISLNLRHGISVKSIVEELDTIDEVYVGSFIFHIKKFLSGYIPNGHKSNKICKSCGSKNVIYIDGCDRCNDCGNTKCG